MSHNVLLNTFLCKWPESLITQYKQLEFVFKTCPFFERLDPILQAVKRVHFFSLFFGGQGDVWGGSEVVECGKPQEEEKMNWLFIFLKQIFLFTLLF